MDYLNIYINDYKFISIVNKCRYSSITSRPLRSLWWSRKFAQNRRSLMVSRQWYWSTRRSKYLRHGSVSTMRDLTWYTWTCAPIQFPRCFACVYFYVYAIYWRDRWWTRRERYTRARRFVPLLRIARSRSAKGVEERKLTENFRKARGVGGKEAKVRKG